MLLEVSASVACNAAQTPFLCETSVHASVRIAVEHVTRLVHLRDCLAAAVTASGASGDEVVGTKRARSSDEAHSTAATLLSPLAIGRKTVMTIELLEQALAALGGVDQPTGNHAGAGLFFAGRWLDADKTLGDYVGRNEKSKVKVAFGPMAGADAPASSAVADGTTSVPATAAKPEHAAPATLGLAKAVPAPSDSTSSAAATDSAQSGAPSSGERAVSLSAFFRGAGQTRHGEDDDGDGGGSAGADDDAMPLLSARQAELLVASTDVRAALRDPRLQAELRHIDSAPTREGALHRLSRALADPDFERFTRTALREIGYDQQAGDAAHGV